MGVNVSHQLIDDGAVLGDVEGLSVDHRRAVDAALRIPIAIAPPSRVARIGPTLLAKHKLAAIEDVETTCLVPRGIDVAFEESVAVGHLNGAAARNVNVTVDVTVRVSSL